MSSTSKMLAARAALKLVRSNTTVGLGYGSPVTLFIEALGQAIQAGDLHDVVGIPSSVPSENLARAVGIPVVDFGTHAYCDLTIDGADKFDPSLDLIKGLGGALLREK